MRAGCWKHRTTTDQALGSHQAFLTEPLLVRGRRSVGLDHADGYRIPGGGPGRPTVSPRLPRRERRPQILEGVVRPGRFERPTYRFVARTGEEVDHHQDKPSTTKDEESGGTDGEE